MVTKEYQIEEINKFLFTPIREILSLGFIKELNMEYYDQAEIKNENLFKLNLTTKTFRFRALGNPDLHHFQVGIDTDCCQRIGGEGSEAAINSFINPLAGVVVLEVNHNNSWVLVAQSYFHYVPEEEMIILDNIEAVPKSPFYKIPSKRLDIVFLRCTLF